MAAMSSLSFCPELPRKPPAALRSAFPSVSLKMSKFRASPRASASPSILATASPLNTFSAPQTGPSTKKKIATRIAPASRNPRNVCPGLPCCASIASRDDFTSGLRGFACLGVVVAFAINRRDFCAHAAQVGSKLAAVMNRMMQAEHHKLHRGPLEHPAKIHDLH